MEKLVKLLNEYVGQDSYWIDEFDNGAYITWGDGDQCFIDEHIISKNFGFIQWLVDNDKICNESIDEVVEDCGTDGIGAYYCKCYGVYESLLMLLAIQDEPIDYLTSVLK